MTDDIKNIISIIAIIVVVFMLGRCSAENTAEDRGAQMKLETIARRIDYLGQELDSRMIMGRTDTVVRKEIVYRRRIVWRDSIKIVYRGDTTFSTQPFTASIDTVLNSCDTLSVSYEYPRNTLSLMLRQCPDTIRTIAINTIQYETRVVRRPLWVDILSHIGAAGVGIGIGYTIGR